MPAVLPAALPTPRPARARSSRALAVLAGGVLTLSFVATDAALNSPTASAAAPDVTWERLAVCESGGNWSINTGNGYYGGLQFNLATWRGLGLGGYPHQASKSQQIAAANKLHDARGFQPWPACRRKLDLDRTGYPAPPAPAPAPAVAPAPAPAPAVAPAPAAAAPAAATLRASGSTASRSRVSSSPRRFGARLMTLVDRAEHRRDLRAR